MLEPSHRRAFLKRVLTAGAALSARDVLVPHGAVAEPAPPPSAPQANTARFIS
jgi:hypothetical protein